MRFRVGFDVGGTFTDFALQADDGRLLTGKRLTTHHRLMHRLVGDGGEVQAMEEFEEREVLADDKRRHLQGRMGLDRLEMETEFQRDVARTPNPILNLIELAWRRFL